MQSRGTAVTYGHSPRTLAMGRDTYSKLNTMHGCCAGAVSSAPRQVAKNVQTNTAPTSDAHGASHDGWAARLNVQAAVLLNSLCLEVQIPKVPGDGGA